MHFLDLIRDDQQVELTIGETTVTLPRARLGIHLQLARAADRASVALRDGNHEEASRHILDYLGLAGVQTRGVDAVCLLSAFIRLQQLNQLREVFPFMLERGDPSEERPPYSYDGRVFALWIHRLAVTYGWSREDILGLWPEEAMAYVQEAIVYQYDEADRERSLSEAGYSYDKTTGASRFVPVTRPGWMVGDDGRTPTKTPKRMVPLGVVVDISGMGPADEEKVH